MGLVEELGEERGGHVYQRILEYSMLQRRRPGKVDEFFANLSSQNNVEVTPKVKSDEKNVNVLLSFALTIINNS